MELHEYFQMDYYLMLDGLTNTKIADQIHTLTLRLKTQTS